MPAYNPLGKVPTLVFDDGESLFDSSVIVGYLDKKTPVAHLIPQDNFERALVRRWEALADGMCDAAVAAGMERRRAPEQQDPALVERQLLKVEHGLGALARDLGENKWCMGETFGLADIAVGCMLAYLDLRLAELAWREAYPNLARLYEHLLARPSFRDTAPPAA